MHTRLTHSLEVSQVGKILGNTLGSKLDSQQKLPAGYFPSDLGSIVEAACLAHDLGNPPFGHAGEEAMRHWFESNGPLIFGSLTKDHKHDLLTFEGNAQGFRKLTQTENHVFQGGLRLTYATLGAYMKYPWTSEKKHPKNKFSVFISESKILNDVATELGLIKKNAYEWARHPLAYLVEAADDICYYILDLEDAVELKIISFEEASNMLLEVFDDDEREKMKKSFIGNEYRTNLSRIRGHVFEKVIAGAIDGFMKSYDSIMTGKLEGTVFTALDEKNSAKKLMKKLAENSAKIYKDENKVEIELGCYATFETLLSTFCNAAIENSKYILNTKGEHSLGWKTSLVLKMFGAHAPNNSNAPENTTWSEYQCLRRAIDYVSGMTDNYAVNVASQIQGNASSNSHRY